MAGELLLRWPADSPDEEAGARAGEPLEWIACLVADDWLSWKRKHEDRVYQHIHAIRLNRLEVMTRHLPYRGVL